MQLRNVENILFLLIWTLIEPIKEKKTAKKRNNSKWKQYHLNATLKP